MFVLSGPKNKVKCHNKLQNIIIILNKILKNDITSRYHARQLHPVALVERPRVFYLLVILAQDDWLLRRHCETICTINIIHMTRKICDH